MVSKGTTQIKIVNSLHTRAVRELHYWTYLYCIVFDGVVIAAQCTATF